MRRLPVYFAAAIVTCSPAVVSAQSQTPSETTGLGSATPGTNPAAEDELKALVGELFALEKSPDAQKSTALYADLTIPNHREWFETTFGKEEGARLEAKYVSSSDDAAARLKRSVKAAVKENRTFLSVAVFEKPNDTSMGLVSAVLSAMTNPLPLYDLRNATSPDDKSPYFFGYFVYVDGGFRYMDLEVMRALSSAPPLRIRVGGAVQRAQLVSSVQPEYPEDAKNAGIEGTVRLHVIIAQDGRIQQIQVASGQPLLVKAALDAVRLWRYKPTLLNGQAVEVDTEVDVTFQLKN
jgi:TonB family protein